MLLLLGSATANYALGLWISRARRKKIVLALAAFFNLSLLLHYKYAAFLAGALNEGLRLALPVPAPRLPIGISFYTFQALSYVIDVYRGRVAAQKNWLRLSLYICLFPQLIAGPIVRYADIADQLETREMDGESFARGVRRFVCGLGKKALLADLIAPLADEAFGASRLAAPAAWIGLLAYALQIYFDFSGYSDMAIGIGGMLGFRFPENFAHPYAAASLRAFWQRWHMTLSGWLRDYAYIPLGGSRRGAARGALNLLIVFALTGLWHGAGWTFLFWGLLHGIGRVADGAFRREDLARRLFCLAVVLGGWILFRSETLTQALAYASALFTPGALNLAALTPRAIALMLIALVGVTPLPLRIWSNCRGGAWEGIKWFFTLVLCALIAVSLWSGTYSPFLYFRF